jgi:hypothetical protein
MDGNSLPLKKKPLSCLSGLWLLKLADEASFN